MTAAGAGPAWDFRTERLVTRRTVISGVPGGRALGVVALVVLALSAGCGSDVTLPDRTALPSIALPTASRGTATATEPEPVEPTRTATKTEPVEPTRTATETEPAEPTKTATETEPAEPSRTATATQTTTETRTAVATATATATATETVTIPASSEPPTDTPTAAPSSSEPAPAETEDAGLWWLLAVLAGLAALIAAGVMWSRRRSAAQGIERRFDLVRSELTWADTDLLPRLMASPSTAEANELWQAGRPRLLAVEEELRQLAVAPSGAERQEQARQWQIALASLVTGVDAETSLPPDADSDRLRAARAQVEEARRSLLSLLNPPDPNR